VELGEGDKGKGKDRASTISEYKTSVKVEGTTICNASF
jgi:hypothetical protein